MNNPFETRRHGRVFEPQTVAERLEMVRRFDLEQCADALALPDLPGTVRAALWRRVKSLLRVEGLDLQMPCRSQGG